MTTTFLAKVHRDAPSRTVAETRTLRTRADFDGLSYYTLCALADTAHIADPRYLPERGEVWVIDLDALGNFVRAESLGRAIPSV